MNEVIARVERSLAEQKLTFQTKPILIGGMVMEYYGMRKSGADIDLVITGEDYEYLAKAYPEKEKTFMEI